MCAFWNIESQVSLVLEESSSFNPLKGRGNYIATSNGLLHLVQRGGAWAGWGPAQSPHRCTKCNSPPINGQCTNFILFDVAI